MPRRTREAAKQTRETLVAIARDMFATQGFDAVALEELAAAAGVTRGALYHHFDGKVSLFREVVCRVLTAMGQDILHAAEDVDDSWESLRAGCHVFLERARDPEYQQLILLDAPVVLGIKEWQALDEIHTTAKLRQALAELDAAGRISTTDTSALADALSGAMNQLVLWIGAQPHEEEAVMIAQQTLDALLTSTHSAPPTERKQN